MTSCFLVCLVRQTSPRLTGHIYTTNAVFKYIEHSRAKILVHVLGPPRAIRRPAYRRSQSETLSRVRPRRSVSAHSRRHQPLATRASGAGTVKGNATEIGSHPPTGNPGRDAASARAGRVGLDRLDAVWRPGARRRDRPVPEVGEEPIRTKDVIQQDGGILASGSAPRHMCSSPACPGTAR